MSPPPERQARRLRARLGALLVSCVWLLFLACGPSKRPCLEEAECFAGEFCDDKGFCAPYRGRVVTTPRQPDMDPVTIPDQDDPFQGFDLAQPRERDDLTD